MKKKNLLKHYYGLLLAALSVTCLGFCSNASATSLTSTNGDMWIDKIQYERGIYGDSNWGLYTPTAPSNTNQLAWTFSLVGFNSSTSLTRLYIEYKTAPTKSALVNFEVRYSYSSPSSGTSVAPVYNGIKFKKNIVLLSEQCFNSQGIAYAIGSTVKSDFTCNYLVYITAGRKSIDTQAAVPIVAGPIGANGTLSVMVLPANYVELTNDGLSDDDRAWLEEHMPAGSSTADVESAIESAREDEKAEYEEQQENVDGGAEDAGDEAEAATSTLIETGRNIIETIRDTPATNCVIRINTRNFDTGNLNLCNVPQVIRTMISSVITIPVTLAALHIAYSVVMLYLTTVRKEQE